MGLISTLADMISDRFTISRIERENRESAERAEILMKMLNRERIEVENWEVERGVEASMGSTDRLISDAFRRWRMELNPPTSDGREQEFRGDPISEAVDRCADLYAFSVEMLRQKLITEDEADKINMACLEAHKVMMVADARRKVNERNEAHPKKKNDEEKPYQNQA